MPRVLELIKELALYEKAPDEVLISQETLLTEGFGPNKLFDTLVAEMDNEIVGMVLYYPVFSTWKGRSIYLEDFVVLVNIFLILLFVFLHLLL